jgi:hypothetical protein
MKAQSDTERKLRGMTNEDVCKWIAGFNDDKGLGFRLLGHHELQRRLRQPDAIRSWIAIAISITALLISICLHFRG